MSRRALVIAVTRLGDIIQTEPMVRALKAEGRFDKATVLVERSFADIAGRITSADELKCIDFEAILGRLDRSCAALPMREYLALADWLLRNSFDTVYNVTHSRPSMMLAALASHETQGVTLDQQGMQVVNNRWLQYFFATNLARPWCSFNLVDIYVNAVDPLVAQSERKPQLVSGGARDKRTLKFNDGEVLLHVGASKSDKQWPLEKFVVLSQYLLDRGLSVTLLGGGKSEAISRAFPAHKNFQDLLGMTSIGDLFDLCQNASLLVSADSGPVHVAAACDLPIIAIEGGSAHGFETAPYKVGSIVIQPHLDRVMSRRPTKHATSASSDLVSVETVISAIDFLAGGSDQITSSPQCTVYETINGENVPGLDLRAISGSNSEYEEWQQRLRRFWWRVGGGHSSCNSQPANDLTSCAMASAKAARLISQAGNNFTSLEESAASLSATEHSLTKMIEAYPPLHHLNFFLQIARSSVHGELPHEQAQELEKLYDDVAEAAAELELTPSHRSVKKQYNSNSEKVPA
ncbi:MAG: glycosyltransferase family 9 protein [bacterium]|nr:glycosyltransferase family 9 protein [bacterium]